MDSRLAGTVMAAATALAITTGCALPPPPGALVKWADVRPSEIPMERPLAEVPIAGDALLHASEAPRECDSGSCDQDPGAWFTRCVEPRARAAAAAVRQHLLGSRQWHAPALASLRAPSSGMTPPPGCDANGRVQQAATRIVWAVGALAAADAAAACPALRLSDVKFGLYEIDRSKESFGEWLRRDYPSIVGSCFAGILTGAMAMPLGDLVSRIATLDLTFVTGGGVDARPALTLSVRGGASTRLASGKVPEDENTAPPPQLASVALATAIGRLDRELQDVVQAGCRRPPG